MKQSLKTQLPHLLREVDFSQSSYPPSPPFKTRTLKVSSVHTLFFALYGNPEGIPVVVLHGGPGGGCLDSMTRSFDLTKWFVIMFDQRGAMRSEPFACMEENTSQDLVSDVEKLRKHLGIEKWMVFGGSWGSALALLYGQAHADRVLGFVLRGIFLARVEDHLNLLHGMGDVYPEEHERFVCYIPEDERGDLFDAYYKRIMSLDPGIHLPAARAFFRFDLVCSTLLPEPDQVEKLLQNDRAALSISKAFFHYSKNNFFLRKDQIIEEMGKIAHLPAIIVHGRRDVVCLPKGAFTLYQNWPASQLWFVPKGSHISSDLAMATALAAATDSFMLL